MNCPRKPVVVQGGPHKDSFSIVTYNILADCHVKGHEKTVYPFVEEEFLFKKDGPNSKRHLLTMQELRHFNCDVILLQEVEDWYSPYLETDLRKSGYEYKFFSKVDGWSEGSALCFKSSRFECVEMAEFVIHQELERTCEVESVPGGVIAELKRSSVALIGVLRDLVTNQLLICAGTHIIYNKFDRPALQALQACLVCQELDRMREKLKTSHKCTDVSIVFAGDFNGEPDHMSIQLMKNGTLTDKQLETLESLGYEVKEKGAVPVKRDTTSLVTKYLSKYLNNPLKLSSSYFDVLGSEPSVTSAEAEYVGSLDYIFFTPASLKVVSVIEVDTVRDSYAQGGPTAHFGSDHLPLIAEFTYN